MKNDLEVRRTRIWDIPIRIWHWLFAISLTTSWVTGYFTELYATTVHAFSGFAVFSLLIYRLLWGLCGGDYVRWTHYWTTPIQFLKHFTRGAKEKAHTAPGIILVILLMLAALVQSSTGLFTTDDIFFEGPLTQYVEEDFSNLARWIHHQNWWIIVTLVSIHLLAHLIYLVVLRDKLPLSMFHGMKKISGKDTQDYPIRALLCGIVAIAVFSFLYNLF
ncbi:MAG: cytochrome b/b6 domain-containing protein [Gammaproteobacteria bacterium]|nr:cytochrome b/b6 domain-containing protein [Gammaproteobacteria bacterium]